MMMSELYSEVLQGGEIPDPVLQRVDMKVQSVIVDGIQVVSEQTSNIVRFVIEGGWGAELDVLV